MRSDEALSTARSRYLRRFCWVDGHADTWSPLADAATLDSVIRGLAVSCRERGATKVLGIEARGFLVAPAVARDIGAGFVAVRKAVGLFPGDLATARTRPDYRGNEHELRIRRSDVTARDRVILVDDWIETGSQAAAVKTLIEDLGATWLGCSVIIDEADQETRDNVGPVTALLRGADLP